jgi:hypothetical protein
MKILVTGDREWSDRETMWKVLAARLAPGDILIEGEARGADKMARQIAEELGIKVEKYPADWNAYGKAAGPIRNQQMIDEGKPQMAIAFHNNLWKGKGTKDMVTRLKKHNIRCLLACTGVEELEEL